MLNLVLYIYYSIPLYIRSPHLQLKSGLIRGMDSLAGYNLVVFTISVHLKSGLMRGAAFDGSDCIRGGLLYMLKRNDLQTQCCFHNHNYKR